MPHNNTSKVTTKDSNEAGFEIMGLLFNTTTLVKSGEVDKNLIAVKQDENIIGGDLALSYQQQKRQEEW